MKQNDKAWRQLFERYGIADEVRRSGQFVQRNRTVVIGQRSADSGKEKSGGKHDLFHNRQFEWFNVFGFILRYKDRAEF